MASFMITSKQMIRGQPESNNVGCTFALLASPSCQFLTWNWVLWHGLCPPSRSLTFNPKLNSDRSPHLCGIFAQHIFMFLWPHSPHPSLAIPKLSFIFFWKMILQSLGHHLLLCSATVIPFSVSSGGVSRWWSGEAVWHPAHSCLAGLTGLLCLSVITPEWRLSASLCLYLTPPLF